MNPDRARQSDPTTARPAPRLRVHSGILVALLAGAIGLTDATAQIDGRPNDVPVMMSAADQARVGLMTAPLESREIPGSVRAIVRVVDPTPLAMLDADLAAASAMADASARELERTAGLASRDQSASQQALEAARAKAAADRSALTLLERRLGFEWGPGIAALSSSERADLVADLAAGRAALVRADAPERPDGLDGRVLVGGERDATPTAAESLGLTATAEPRMQTIGLYALVRDAAARRLRPGRTLIGRIETMDRVSGVVVPRSALVRLDGLVWAYLKTGDELFVRREVADSRPLDDGWFVASGFSAGAAVVVDGAGSLIAVERGDESAESD